MTLSPHARLLEGPDEQQIDVGARRQLSAAVAAGRHDRQRSDSVGFCA